MTRVLETDVALKRAEPVVDQHGPESQAFGHIIEGGVRLAMAHRDYDAGRSDAVAGCEFVDDRIRLPE